jgi:hypothetical protein
MNKAELLTWLQSEYLQWQALLAQIGPERMDQPGVSADWSIKDIVAHLASWQRRTNARLAAALHSEPAPPPLWPAQMEAEDDINAWIYESNRERSVGAVLEESEQAFQQLLGIVTGFPDDIPIESAYRVVQFGEQRFSVSEFFDHFHDDHKPDLRAWLARGQPS